MDLKEFQEEMAARFAEFDRESGPFFLMTVLTAELGELAEAVKNDDRDGVSEELSDLFSPRSRLQTSTESTYQGR